jgi:hypothetical protein
MSEGRVFALKGGGWLVVDDDGSNIWCVSEPPIPVGGTVARAAASLRKAADGLEHAGKAAGDGSRAVTLAAGGWLVAQPERCRKVDQEPYDPSRPIRMPESHAVPWLAARLRTLADELDGRG